MESLIIHLSCADRPGIIAKVTRILFDHGGNIISLEQHVEAEKLFFMRVRVDVENYTDETIKHLDILAKALSAKLTWRIISKKQNIAIMVSKEPHCLIDLLSKYEAGEINCQIPLIISNHKDLEKLVSRYNIPFYYIPLENHDSQQHEKRIIELLQENKVDLVVLARYMKILSNDFVSQFEKRIINIHHSFLPAFKGSRPYHRAWQRGVKVIGATAHFATIELDEGPIISQGVKHISHHHSPKSLIEAGREIEQSVLSDAVKAWLEYRIIIHNNRTIVFHP